MKKVRGCAQSDRGGGKKKNHRKFPLQDWIRFRLHEIPDETLFRVKPSKGIPSTIMNPPMGGVISAHTVLCPTEKLKGMGRVPVTCITVLHRELEFYSSLRFLLYDC